MLPEASRPASLRLDRRQTPVGEALIVTDETGALRAFDFADYEPRMLRLMARHYPGQAIVADAAPKAVAAAVDAYFQGDLDALSGLDWKTNGTEFQRKVWAGLCTIPARRDPQLSGPGRPGGLAQGHAGGRPGQWFESSGRRRALPQGDRGLWPPDRLWRRASNGRPGSCDMKARPLPPEPLLPQSRRPRSAQSIGCPQDFRRGALFHRAIPR